MSSWDWDFDLDYEERLIEAGYLARPRPMSIENIYEALREVYTGEALERQFVGQRAIVPIVRKVPTIPMEIV